MNVDSGHERALFYSLEKYIRAVEANITDEDYFVPIPHQDLHWLCGYVHRLIADDKHPVCGHPIYKHPVGSPHGPTIEEFTTGIQRALDEAVQRRNSEE